MRSPFSMSFMLTEKLSGVFSTADQRMMIRCAPLVVLTLYSALDVPLAPFHSLPVGYTDNAVPLATVLSAFTMSSLLVFSGTSIP